MHRMMMKTFLAAVLACGSLYAGSAAGSDLESNMTELNRHMVELQDAFIRGDKAKARGAVTALETESRKLLANEAGMQRMLPKGKQHLVRVAVTAARMIEEDSAILKESLDDTRRERAQEAYLGIQRACMRCHNLVRDW